MSPKGVPHIFEYAVGPGVFSASLASRFSPEWILVPCSDQVVEESMTVALHSPQQVVTPVWDLTT